MPHQLQQVPLQRFLHRILFRVKRQPLHRTLIRLKVRHKSNKKMLFHSSHWQLVFPVSQPLWYFFSSDGGYCANVCYQTIQCSCLQVELIPGVECDRMIHGPHMETVPFSTMVATLSCPIARCPGETTASHRQSSLLTRTLLLLLPMDSFKPTRIVLPHP